MITDDIRTCFPQLEQTVYGKPLVYLDNAATSLRPVQVVQKWTDMSLKYNSNLHRAVHHTAVVATEEYESTRQCVADFIGAEKSESIVFTSGTTASINLLAYSLGNYSFDNAGFFEKGDEILICESEHHSNIVPWQMLALRNGLKINILPIQSDGEISLESLSSCLTPRTKLCCVAQVSNVLGIVNPVKEIARICHERGILLLVDGAQGVVHVPTDVKDMDCDFYVFSGHKMYAAPGTGVLYGKPSSLFSTLPPFMGGGEMIESVSWSDTKFAPLPRKFEAGTQNISGVPTFKPAIDMVKSMRDNEIEDNLRAIVRFLSNYFSSREDITLYGKPEDLSKKIPLFSISVEGVHHEDLTLILDKMGIATRSGQMCAEPLMDRFGVTGMLRASFAPYNTMEEAEYFVKCLEKAIGMLR